MINPSKRKTKAEIASERIEAAIVNCELKPGSVLIEAEISEWLDLGRTPVREALVGLASANLVRLSRAGVIIPELNAMKMLKLLELREPIERLCVERAVLRQNSADQDAFRDLQSKLSETPPNARRAFMTCLWDVHKTLASASQNEFIYAALKTTQGLSRRYWGYYATESDQDRATEIYRDLLGAIISHEAAHALAASEELISYLRDFTLVTMDRMSGPTRISGPN